MQRIPLGSTIQSLYWDSNANMTVTAQIQHKLCSRQKQAPRRKPRKILQFLHQVNCIFLIRSFGVFTLLVLFQWRVRRILKIRFRHRELLTRLWMDTITTQDRIRHRMLVVNTMRLPVCPGHHLRPILRILIQVRVH